MTRRERGPNGQTTEIVFEAYERLKDEDGDIAPRVLAEDLGITPALVRYHLHKLIKGSRAKDIFKDRWRRRDADARGAGRARAEDAQEAGDVLEDGQA